MVVPLFALPDSDVSTSVLVKALVTPYPDSVVELLAFPAKDMSSCALV